METQNRIGSSLTQRCFHKNNKQSSLFNINLRLNNHSSQLTERKALQSLNNSINNIKNFNLKYNTSATSTPVSRQKKRSKMQLKQYLDLIKQMNSKTIRSKANPSSYTSSPSLSIKIANDAWMRQHNNTHLKKRKPQPHIPYNQIQAIVSKVFKHFDTIKKFGYSDDQVSLIIRQIFSKRKNIEYLLLNKKQKPKRSYYTYEIKKQTECIQAIIKESLENLNGKFESIFRDLNNFCNFFQEQIIERGCGRIKQIKKSVVHLKSQLQTNQYSQQLGFNQFLSRKQMSKEKRQEKYIKANFSISRKSVAKYMSSISKNIDSQLRIVQNQIGDFLEQNRNFVEVLGKISQAINK